MNKTLDSDWTLSIAKILIAHKKRQQLTKRQTGSSSRKDKQAAAHRHKQEAAQECTVKSRSTTDRQKTPYQHINKQQIKHIHRKQPTNIHTRSNTQTESSPKMHKQKADQ